MTAKMRQVSEALLLDQLLLNLPTHLNSTAALRMRREVPVGRTIADSVALVARRSPVVGFGAPLRGQRPRLCCAAS